MKTTTTVTLADLSDAYDTDADELSPRDYARDCDPIIVCIEDGRVDIVDGFHRAAGLRAWAESEGLDLASVTVSVIDAAGAPQAVIDAAANPGMVSRASHRAAIKALQDGSAWQVRS